MKTIITFKALRRGYMTREREILASSSTALYFETGVEWVRQFPISVWHNADEEPKKHRYILVEVINTLTSNNKTQYYTEYTEDGWKNFMKIKNLKCCWAYINDLISKNK